MVLGNEGRGITGTPVCCTSAMADFLASNEPCAFMVRRGRIVPTPLATDRWHRVGARLAVQLRRVPHRDEFADTVGFVFRGPSRTLLFVPDVDDRRARDLAETVAGLDGALLDASFSSLDEVPGRTLDDLPHPLIGRAMDRLQGVVDRGEAEVVLTHLNNSSPALDADGAASQSPSRTARISSKSGTTPASSVTHA